MRLVLATPLYPPDIGGPSQYALRLSDALRRQGHEVSIVTYGALKKLPSGVRHALYAAKLLYCSIGADAVLAFDTFSTGLPAAVVCKLLRIPFGIRIGGDFLWEMYVNRTRDAVPLVDFYKHDDTWNSKERFIFSTTRWCLSQALLFFNSRWLLDIWKDAYALEHGKVFVVENAYAPCEGGEKPRRRNFLFYSRDTFLKNRDSFRRAFERAKHEHTDIELEEGAVPHDELMKRIQSCYAVVVPSLSDVAPNYILDAIHFGKPFLLTKYSGYADRFKEYGVIVDPLNEAAMAEGIARLANREEYDKLAARIGQFKEAHTYDDIARSYSTYLEINGSAK